MMTNSGAGSARAGRAGLAALGVCAVVAGLYVWGHFWRMDGRADSDAVADVMRYYLPNTLFSKDAVLRGELPLWNPDEMLGMPMLATMEYGPLYPPNWTSLLLPCREARLLTGGLHLWMFAAFLFLYLRRSLGVGTTAALCGALIAAFSEWSVLHLCAVPDTYGGAVWLPLVLLLADRLLERPGPARAAALGGVLALQFLAGEAEISARTGLLLAGYGVFRMGQRLARDGSARRAVAGIVWCCAP